MTQCPSLTPSKILLLAISPIPSPKAISNHDLFLSNLFLAANFSTSFTGSEPGDKMKKTGVD